MVNFIDPVPVLLAVEPGDSAHLAALAARFGWPIGAEADWVLAAAAGRLELRAGRGRRLAPIHAHAQGPRRRLGRGDPFARALGSGRGLVVDATAGLGGDTRLIASLGRSVLAVERHPALWALLDDALGGLEAAGIELVLGDARAVLPRLDPAPAVVYLDPMFPPRRKRSAQPRKEARALRALAGDDEDAAELLAVARATAHSRVVVKRPGDAPPLAAGAVSSHGGKRVRYDVYGPVRSP